MNSVIVTEEEIKVNEPPWGLWPTIGFGFAVGAVLVVTQIITAGIYIAIRFSPSLQNLTDITDKLFSEIGLLTSIATLVSSIICIGFVFLLIKLRHTYSITDYLGIRTINGKTLLILLAITIGFLALSYSVNLLLGRTSVNEFMINIYKTSISPIFFWIVVIFFAPAFEEVFFRGFLFEGFSQSRVGIIGAILLTSLGWAVLHLQYDIYDILTIFVLGLILGTIRYKTKSLYAPLFIHALNNLIASVEMAIYISGTAI